MIITPNVKNTIAKGRRVSLKKNSPIIQIELAHSQHTMAMLCINSDRK